LIAQHAGDLTRAVLPVDHAHVARRHAPFGSLRHQQVAIGLGGDLRQVSDDEDLTTGIPTSVRDL
jgi:hypothetical protein